jgi:hypothetical protein
LSVVEVPLPTVTVPPLPPAQPKRGDDEEGAQFIRGTTQRSNHGSTPGTSAESNPVTNVD